MEHIKVNYFGFLRHPQGEAKV